MKFFNIMPAPSFRRQHVTYSAVAFCSLVGVPNPGAKKTLAEVLPLLLEPRVLARLLAKGRWEIGRSLTSNGVTLNLNLVNAAQQAAATQKHENMAKKKAYYKEHPEERPTAAQVKAKKRQEADARIAYVKSRPMNPYVTSPLNLYPPNTPINALDGGRYHVCTVARSDRLSRHRPHGGRRRANRDWRFGPWTYSIRQYRTDSGEKQREYAQQRALQKYRFDHTKPDVSLAFVRAEAAIRDNSLKGIGFERMLAATQAYRDAFLPLYGFYGLYENARIRYANYVGAQRVRAMLVKRIVLTKDDVVVCGDSNDTSNAVIKGYSSSRWGKLCSELKRKCGGRFHWMDEHRTSCVDSRHRLRMFNMETLKFDPVDGTTSKKRVYGIYQTSRPGISCTWSRDINAAINMVLIFQEINATGVRPLVFRRGTTFDSVPSSTTYRRRVERGPDGDRLVREAASGPA